MVVAIMHSESFEWVALGKTEQEAGQALVDRWNNDQNNMFEFDGYEPNIYETIDELSEYYGVFFQKLKPGECCKW